MKGRKKGAMPFGGWLLMYGLSFMPTVLFWLFGSPWQDVVLMFIGGCTVAIPYTIAYIYARRVWGLDWPFPLNG